MIVPISVFDLDPGDLGVPLVDPCLELCLELCFEDTLVSPPSELATDCFLSAPAIEYSQTSKKHGNITDHLVKITDANPLPSVDASLERH